MKYKLLRYSLLSLLVMLCGGLVHAADTWVKTDPTALATGDVVVIVDQTSSLAMSNTGGTSSAPAAVAVTQSGDQITGVTDAMQWVVTVANDVSGAPTYQFGVAGTENYLYCINSNNGVRVGTNANNTFIMKQADANNTNDYLFNVANSRYLGVYTNNSEWRCYSTVNSNIKETLVAFYKKTTGDVEPVVTYDYYVVGSMTDWQANSSYKMSRNTEAETEEYMLTKTFAAGDKLKVAKSDGQTINDADWYPTGMDNDYEVTEAGEYIVYFRPGKNGNNDWYEGYFYLAPTQTGVANVAALNALENNTKFKFTGDALVVAKPTAKYVYIKDDTGASLIYDSTGGMTANAEPGKHLAANWTGKVTVYNKLFEAVPDAALAVTDAAAEEIDIPTKNFSYVTAEHVNEVIILAVDSWEAGSGKNLTLKLGDATLAGYNQFSIELPEIEDGKSYVMVGAIGRFNDNIQFQPIQVTEFQLPVAEPVQWPEGVEGETWKVNTTVTVVSIPGNIPVDGQDCQVAYLTDANEAYVKIEVSGVTVIAKGTVDADKNVTIPAGQIVGQLNGQPAAIFATDATSADPADVVFTYSETTEKISLTCAANICLSLGQVGTPMVTLSNTELYKAKEAPAAADYYVVGNMTEWAVADGYKMTKNEAAEGEEYMLTLQLTTESQFKVVGYDGTNQTWFPDGMGNNYGENGEITEDGEYTVYFRPNADGGDDWFYNVIYLEKQGDPALDNVIWSSEELVAVNWGTPVSVAADNATLAKIKVGDKIHVAVVVPNPTPDNDWSAQVAIKDGAWANLEAGVAVGSGNVTDAAFTVTGDILKFIKQNGLQISGIGYSTQLVTYEKTDITGSDASIWLGNDTGKPTVNAIHFQNANDKEGIQAGDVIRVTATLNEVVEGDTWINFSYSGEDTGWDWKDYEGMEKTQTDTGFDFVVNEDNIEKLKKYGITVNQNGYTLTQVEIVKPEEPVTVENLWIVGDADGWGTDQPNLKAMTFNTETEAFEYEVTVANESGLYFAFGDVAASDSWDDFNANYRYAARAGEEAAEVVENQPMQLQKCNGTLVIKTLGVYTVSVTKDLILSIKKTGEIEPVTADKLYVIGDMNNWDRTAMTEMTVNSAGNYEYELTTEADCYFAFATKQLTAEEAEADPNWEDFSANYRWAIAEGNQVPTLEQEYQLEKVNGTIKLAAGQYTVVVTPAMKMTITGTPSGQPTEFEYSAVYVAGNGADKNWLNGASWNAGAEANKLTEVADDVWEITLENVAAGEGYEFKFTVDGGWDVNFGIEDPTAFAFGTEYPGVVDGANITFSLTEASDVTMHLDMSAYDNTTKQGAKFTVTATAAGEEPVEDEGLWITWGEDDVATAGNLQAQYGEEDFYLTYVDNNSKLSIDASNAFFGTADAQKKFTHRLKSGGASNSNNNMTLHIAKAGKLNVYARSGSPSATDRNLVLTQGDTELYNAVVKDADAIDVAEEDLNVNAPALAEGDPKKVYPVITVEVAAGELTIGYPTGSMNFYAFQLIPEEGGTGIRNLEVTQSFDESLPAYNLQGQRVTKSYRGVIIQNGRKFYNK